MQIHFSKKHLKRYINECSFGINSRNQGESISAGDRKMPSLKLAKKLSITEDKVFFQQSPQDKLDAIQKLQKQGKFVLMLGDGWNDAPALAQADLSLSLVSGVDATIETADIILLTPDLSKFLSLMKISNSTLKLVRQNIENFYCLNNLVISFSKKLFWLFILMNFITI